MARDHEWYALERRLQTVLEGWRNDRRNNALEGDE
jgi:hypothetical protein